MNALASVDSAGAINRAYATIRENILSLRYKPKQPLRAQELSEELELSRTPVREALGRLEQEGLVVRDSGWGYVVRDYTLTQAMNLYKVREALEVEAITEAMGKVDDAIVALLTGLLDRAEQSLKRNHVDDFLASCRRFHELIAHTTGNSILEDMIETISGQVRLVSALVFRERSARPADVLKENKKILQAIKKRDLKAAVAAVRHHIRRAGENLFAYFTRDAVQQN